MSEAVRVRAYDWMREQSDATVAEYVMSRLSPVPAADLATKDDVRLVKTDIGRVEGKVDRLVELREADLQQRAAEREADRKERAAEREADLQQRAAEREADLQRREAERKAAGRRAWGFALALPVEVVVLFAGAAAILEWLRG